MVIYYIGVTNRSDIRINNRSRFRIKDFYAILDLARNVEIIGKNFLLGLLIFILLSSVSVHKFLYRMLVAFPMSFF